MRGQTIRGAIFLGCVAPLIAGCSGGDVVIADDGSAQIKESTSLAGGGTLTFNALDNNWTLTGLGDDVVLSADGATINAGYAIFRTDDGETTLLITNLPGGAGSAHILAGFDAGVSPGYVRYERVGDAVVPVGPLSFFGDYSAVMVNANSGAAVDLMDGRLQVDANLDTASWSGLIHSRVTEYDGDGYNSLSLTGNTYNGLSVSGSTSNGANNDVLGSTTNTGSYEGMIVGTGPNYHLIGAVFVTHTIDGVTYYEVGGLKGTHSPED